jgi:Fic family protein
VLFYWSMLRSGFWLFEFVSISQALLRSPTAYYRAFLHTETDDNDVNYFLHHQLTCIETSIKDLHDYLGRKTTEQRALSQKMGQMDWLNHRQRALLTKALAEPTTRFTFASHKRSHGISQMTARTDLITLRDAGLLRDSTAGKERRFFGAPDLEARLRSKPITPPARPADGDQRTT